MKKLILLHGALGCTTLFNSLQKELEQSHKVYTLNFSGHGKRAFSEHGFGIEIFANELESFIKTNKLKGASVFGYSMGGYVALYLASEQPGLIGEIVTLGTKFNWTSESAEHEVAKLNPELIEEKVPVFAEALANRHGKKEWKKLVWQTAGMMLELGDIPLLTNEALSKIESPATICWGDQDNMVTQEESERTAKTLKNGRYITVLNTPHPLEKIDPKVLVNLLNK